MVAKQKTAERNLNSSRKSGKVGKIVNKRTPLPSSPTDENESPIRAIVCLKRINDMRRFEESEDCFILGFDPFDPVHLSKLLLDKNNPANATARHDDDPDADLSVIAEKGQVACRDYPHSRHLCLKFPFKTTPHARHCELCYCYVCDSAAPCKYWSQSVPAHCNAENVPYWKCQRNMKKQQPVARI